MGAWDTGSFGNDSALDFVEAITSISDVEARINGAEASRDDAVRSTEVIAAADILAALYGRPPNDLPKEALKNLSGDGKPTLEILSKARQAVIAIHTRSELADLWEGDPDWTEAIQGLLNRLDPDAEYTPPTPQDDDDGAIWAQCFLCDKGIPDGEEVGLEHIIDDGVIYSTMTLYAHRLCVEKRFAAPHWNDDGTVHENLKAQFQGYLDDLEPD